jgi:hypothetical protein
MKTSCGWRRFGQTRSQGTRLLPLALLLTLPASLWPQDKPQDEQSEAAAAEPRGLPSGFRINSISSWVGRNYLVVPNAGGTASESYLLGYGGGLDAGLYLPEKTGRVSLVYNLGYNGNSTYTQLNGSDHRLSFSWTRNLTRTLSISLTGAGESVTVQGFLFEPATGTTPDRSRINALAGSLVPTGAAGATSSILYPGRRQTATMAAMLSSSASRRFTWHITVTGDRLLPTSSYDSRTRTRLGYSGETDGGANLTIFYALSRRTSFGGNFAYFRTMSPLGTTQAELGGLMVTRVLSRRWFGSATAGYGFGDYFLRAIQTSFRRPDFTGNVALGTTLNSHTLSMSVSQRLSDSYGLGAQRSREANLGWGWLPKRTKWGFRVTAGYERLTGMQVGEIQSAVFRGILTRRLTAKLSYTAEGGYTWGIAQASASLGRQTQNGARFSLVWRPSGTMW